MSKTLNNLMGRWARGYPILPREFGLARQLITNPDTFPYTIGSVDAYASIFNAHQVFYETYDTLFFDIDGKKEGRTESYPKLQTFLSQVPTVSRIYCSGMGFHIYIDLAHPISHKPTYKQLSSTFVQTYKLAPLIDPACVGDVRRVARIPTSMNSKSHTYVVEITPEMTLKEVDQLTSLPPTPTTTEHPFVSTKNGSKFDETNLLDQLPQEANKNQNMVSKSVVNKNNSWTGVYPPCITNAENFLAGIGELGHTSRIHLAGFLLQIGREEELWEYLRKANDFNESTSRYQIAYLKEHDYHPFNCNKVSEEICSFVGCQKSCPFYPYVLKDAEVTI
jgi:hypothetical protein